MNITKEKNNSDAEIDINLNEGDENAKLLGLEGKDPQTSSENGKAASKNGESNSSTKGDEDFGQENPKEQVSKTPTNYESANPLNLIHYFFVVKSLCEMRKKTKKANLKLDDLPLLGLTEETNHKITMLETEYDKYLARHKTPSLFWPIIYVFWRRIVTEQTAAACYATSKLLFAVFLFKVLQCVEQTDYVHIYKWTALLFLSTVAGIYTCHFGFFQGTRYCSQLKPALIGLLYKKIMRLSNYAINQVSVGQLVNIAANDLNFLEFLIFFIYDLVQAPFILIASLAILWSFVGAACLPGVIFLFLVWPLQAFLSRLGGKHLEEKNAITDERVKLTNEMIEGIRLLKMYGWDIEYSNAIMKVRSKEVSSLKRILYTDYFAGHMLMRLSPVIASFLIFVTFYLMGGTLTASAVYSTILLITYLAYSTVQCSSFGFRFITEISLTGKRIVRVLQIKEPEADKLGKPLDEKNGIEFDKFCAAWGGRNEDQNESESSELIPQDKLTLKNVTFSVKKGTLCALVGKVGSGKSSVLMSFLHEIRKVSGNLRVKGRLAYVEQEVVVFPGTMRSNILFGKPFEESRYNEVVRACCLDHDFKELPNTDLTEVGERGVNLSGGQKARLTLARAIYSDADIYLLDDPLSAVDTKVAHELFNNAIRGLLRNKTVLLVTHQVHFARKAEKLIVLENGFVKADGSLGEIIQQDTSIMSIFDTKAKKSAAAGDRQNLDSGMNLQATLERLESDGQGPAVDETTTTGRINDEVGSSGDEKGKLITEEKDESSEVGWDTYWYYIKNSGGTIPLILFALVLISVEVLNVAYMRLLGIWTEGAFTGDVAVKVLLCVLSSFFVILIIREILFVNFALRVSETLHGQMLRRVIRSVVEFFDTNPAGRILNRFSNDVGVLDRFILQVQNDVLDALFYFPTILITVCILFPWLILPTFILIAVYMTLVKVLKKYIVQGRGIELLTRSPIYSLFSTTLSGLISIRVYEQEEKFTNYFSHLLNRNCRAFNFYYDVSRLFAFCADLSAGIFACVGITLLLLDVGLNPAIVGLVCSFLLTIIDRAQYALRQLLMHIMQMASTERIRSYTKIEQESDLDVPKDKEVIEKEHWPSKGEIVYNNVYMKYRKQTDHVLKGVDFAIKPGEKVGCVGRTGAGKSSIIQALFRMVEIDKNAVPDSKISVDNVDISDLGLHTLRKNISIIPQIPFVFMGNVKRNLDPLNQHDESEIINALKETNLWDHINNLPDGLNSDMSNTSSVFSVGQKQLMCLARTILQKNKILVLDEATSNIDFETDNFIQQKILEKFKDSTILTIAHRLSTVANYDRILVMSSGCVKEFDHPYKLLTLNEGDDKITNSEGLFASMVKNTGFKHAAVIFEIAKKSYYKKKEQSKGQTK